VLIALILLSFTLSASAQIVLKHGVTQIGERSGTLGFRVHSLREALRTPAIWMGLFLFGVSAVVWLLVLSRTSLSFAYPFTALTYGVILIFDRTVLKEEVSWFRWFGVVLIMLGIVLVSRTTTS
jgi:drug/metabolite transporter (DMT)-like permease